MTKIIWFNIGQHGLNGVTWTCGIINESFDPQSIKIEDCEFDENNVPCKIWVKKEDLSYPLHRTVEKSFENLEKVAEWVKTSYECEEDIYVGNNNYLHIYNVFDMDNKNEWGYGKPLWD